MKTIQYDEACWRDGYYVLYRNFRQVGAVYVEPYAAFQVGKKLSRGITSWTTEGNMWWETDSNGSCVDGTMTDMTPYALQLLDGKRVCYEKVAPTIEKADLSSYDGGGDSNRYYVKWFEVRTYRSSGFVIYGVGQWSGHIMDWRGCNFYHGRLPGSPVFHDLTVLMDWMEFQIRNGVYSDGMELSGHHSGENECSTCGKDREEVGMISVYDEKSAMGKCIVFKQDNDWWKEFNREVKL